MLVTDWEEFLACPPSRVAAALRLRTVYDGRNALDAARWRAAGLRLVQVGRPDVDRDDARRSIAALPRFAAAS
jgi:UDPglucose 6-dehydrogenase